MTSSRSFPRRALSSAKQWATLMHGLWRYARTGATPDRAYQSMIQLFCSTRGWSNDFLHSLVALVRRPYKLPHANGVLGDLSAADLGRISGTLREQGYYVFPKLLPAAQCDRLLEFALTAPSQPGVVAGRKLAPSVYDRRRPLSPKHKFAEEQLLAHQNVQAILADLSVLAVAQSYLGSQPVLDQVAMWWSTAFQKEACSESAQLFHFDMDRIKWLKFFIYLTDVTPRSGPHCFVPGSHKRNGQPRDLLQRGYARIADEEIARHYPDFVEFTGPRGTIIAEDTRGFHKGKNLEEGDRLVLEFEFCDCLFGGAFERPPLPANRIPAVEQLARTHPRILSKYSARVA